MARPTVFGHLHGVLLALSFLPQLASWGAKLWWEVGRVPAANFAAWDFFFTTVSISAFYPWLGLWVTTWYAALVRRQAKAAVLGAFVLVASFLLMGLGMAMVGYD